MRFWRRNKRKDSDKITHIEHIRPEKALPETPQYVPYQQAASTASGSIASTPSSSSRSTPPNEYPEYMRPPAGPQPFPVHNTPSPQSSYGPGSYGRHNSNGSSPPRSPLSSSHSATSSGPSGYMPSRSLSRSLSRSRSNSMDFGPVSQPTLSATLAAVRNPDSFMIPDEEIFSQEEHQAVSGMVQRQATLHRKVTRKGGYWKSGR